MGEINALHPFREGNGRTSREFFRTLAWSAGYDLDFSIVDKEELLYANVQSFIRNYVPMVKILDKIVSKK
jgi:Protein involved in cell division